MGPGMVSSIGIYSYEGSLISMESNNILRIGSWRPLLLVLLETLLLACLPALILIIHHSTECLEPLHLPQTLAC